MEKIYLSLHTNNPEFGVNEIHYNGYYKLLLTKFSFIESGNWIANTVPIRFAECKKKIEPIKITHFAISDKQGRILWSGKLVSPLFINKGITPEFSYGGLIIPNTIIKV